MQADQDCSRFTIERTPALGGLSPASGPSVSRSVSPSGSPEFGLSISVVDGHTSRPYKWILRLKRHADCAGLMHRHGTVDLILDLIWAISHVFISSMPRRTGRVLPSSSTPCSSGAACNPLVCPIHVVRHVTLPLVGMLGTFQFLFFTWALISISILTASPTFPSRPTRVSCCGLLSTQACRVLAWCLRSVAEAASLCLMSAGNDE